jgi:prepilin-type N-terminal cleavage/methylation domain-containing protein
VKSVSSLQRGLSLVELLIAMAILGILLAMLSAFLIDNQRVTNTQITAATISNDLRLAHLRIGEIVSQAHYIYPSGQNLSLGTTTFTTGAAALAVLVPRGTTYCKAQGATATARDYCGFAYVIEDRTPYVSLLGLGDTTNQVIVEYKVEGLEWNPTKAANAKETPAEFLTSWPAASTSPVADSVNPAATDLAGLGQLERSSRTGTFDNEAGFDLGVVLDEEKALRDNYVFSKAIPRNSLPNAPK